MLTLATINVVMSVQSRMKEAGMEKISPKDRPNCGNDGGWIELGANGPGLAKAVSHGKNGKPAVSDKQWAAIRKHINRSK